MKALFDEKVLKNEIPTNKMILYTKDIEDYSDNEIQIHKDPGMSLSFILGKISFIFHLDIMDDPSVPTRERIKALSAKLLELNLQEE